MNNNNVNNISEVNNNNNVNNISEMNNNNVKPNGITEYRNAMGSQWVLHY